MTEFEKQLLQHLEQQAHQLTELSLSHSQTTQKLIAMSKEQAEQATAIGALSSHQEVTSSQLMGLQTTMDQVLKALSKEPSGESLEATLKSALQPLQSSLDVLIKSFNKLADYSQELSARLPQQPKQ